MNIQFHLLIPELWLLAIIAVLFVQTLRPVSDDGLRPFPSWLPAAAGLGIVAALAGLGSSGLMFYKAYQIDTVSQFFKLVVAIGFFITVINASRQPTLKQNYRSDYFLFLAISAWGLMLLASTVELITAYVALEISSYSLYALVPLRADSKRSAEAGIKYILFGAVATALALYGFSYILATCHTSYIAELATQSWSFAASPGAVAGLGLFLFGFFFKLALFPFHFWCPDIYEGSSNETAAYLATLPKLGAIVILIRLAGIITPGTELMTFVAVLGAVSMTIGNLAALAQHDLKRILGYSSVAHAGVITLGLVSGTQEGLMAAAFYGLAYVLMNLTAFWVISRVSTNGRNLSLTDLAGLHKRAPSLAAILAVAAFSLVGLPPTAGFIGKFFLLTSAWGHGYNWLVIVAAINTAIGAFYYLNIVRHCYTSIGDAAAETESEGTQLITDTPAMVGFGILLALLVLALGCFPGPALSIAG